MLGEFDLPHVKTADARNFVMFVDDGRSLPLGLGEDNVGEVGAGGDNTDLLEVVVRHDCNFTTATSETVFITVGRLLGYIDWYFIVDVTISLAQTTERGREGLARREAH